MGEKIEVTADASSVLLISREQLMAARQESQEMKPGEIDALQRLLLVAASDTGQSRKVANFLLAWWNAETCGGFDLTDLWGLDASLRNDAITVFGMVARVNSYPDTAGFKAEFERMVADWRPELVK